METTRKSHKSTEKQKAKKLGCSNYTSKSKRVELNIEST